MLELCITLWALVSCHPSLDDAVSTMVVWDKDWQNLCIREVHAVTLAEVFDSLGDHYNCTDLYHMWAAGRLVMRARMLWGPLPAVRSRVAEILN